MEFPMPAHQPLAARAAMRGNLLENIKIKYGPVDVIGRFLLLGEEEALRRGISLSFATFGELLKVNETNSDSWRPLVAVFDPRLDMLEPSSSYCILGRNERGEVVSAQAARLYDWQKTTFYDEATSLRFIYGNPTQDKLRGEGIKVTAKEARDLTGRVVFSGAGWYRRDYRNTGLSIVLPRVSRACALTLWDPDYVMTLMAEPVFRGGFAERGGFLHSASSVQWTNSSLGNIDLVLVWMTADEAHADLAAASESLVSRDQRQVGGGSR
jgi:hypothetical protein